MRELLIKSYVDKNTFFLIEDDKLVEYYEEDLENKTLEGNIYIGKVQNIVTGLEAAFINLGEDKNAFIHKKDILPKKDEKVEKNIDDTSITKLIKPGMPLLVEIKKDKMQTKGARVSTHISLRGRFVVLMPNSPYVTVSAKIEDIDKKESLKKFVKENLPEGMGAIIRTNAEFVKQESIKKDIQNQLQKWEEIKNEKTDYFPKKVYDSGGMLKKLLIDLVDYKLDKIVVDNKNLYDSIKKVLKEFDVDIEIKLISDDIEELYDIKKVLFRMSSNKIWLKSGGFITIDYTEALTAIDVNTGKFIRKK